MLKNVAGQKVTLFAFSSTGNNPIVGDAANLTAYISKDDGSYVQLTDTSASEDDSTNAKGMYTWDVSQSETNADKLKFTAKSSTAYVEVVPLTLWTRPANFPSLEISSQGYLSHISGNVQGNVLGGVGGSVGSVAGSVSGDIKGHVVGNVSGNLVGGVGGSVGSVAGSVSGDVKGHVIGNLSGNVVGSVGSVAGNVAGGVVGSVGSVAGSVSGDVKGHVIQNISGNLVGSAGSVLGNVGGNVVGGVGGSVGSVAGSISGDVKGHVIGNLSGNVQGNVTGSVGSVAGNVGGGVAGSVGSVAGSVSGDVKGHVIQNISGNLVGSAGSVLGNVGGNVVGGVGGSVGSVAGSVSGDVKGHVIGNISGNLVGSAGSIVGNVGGNVLGGVLGSVGSVAGSVSGDVSGNVLGYVDRIQSPGSLVSGVWNAHRGSGAFVTGGTFGFYLDHKISQVSGGGGGGGSSAWEELLGDHVTPGTFGYVVGTYLDRPVSLTHLSGYPVSHVIGDIWGHLRGNVSGNIVGSVTGVDVLLSRLTSGRATNLDNLDVLVSSRHALGGPVSSVQGSVSGDVRGNILGSVTGVDVLLSRLTATRAANLENLDYPISSRHPAGSGIVSVGLVQGSISGNVLGHLVGNVSGTVNANVSTTGVDVLLSRLTDTRALNLDNLNAEITSRHPAGSGIVSVGVVQGSISGNVLGHVVGNLSGTLAAGSLTAATFHSSAIDKFASGILVYPTNKILTNANGYVVNSGDVGFYYADIQFTINDSGSPAKDAYTVSWFKDGNVVTNGITSPTITATKRSDGTDLVSAASMTEIGTTEAFKYDASGAARTTNGEVYLLTATASIDSATRTWRRLVSRDVDV